MMDFLRDVFTVFRRNWKEYLRWKLYILFDVGFPVLDALVFIVVWSAIFQTGISIGEWDKSNFVGYLISGLVVWSFMSQFLSGNFIQVFVDEKHRRTIQYLLASRINRAAIPYGYAIMPLIRAAYSSLALIAMGYLFGFMFQGNLVLSILIIALASFMISGMSLCIAALGAWREDIAELRWIFNWVLEISAGVFFPMSIIPERIKSFINLLPTTQAVQAVRDVMLNNASLATVLPTLLSLSAYAIVFTSLALLAFRFVEKKAMMVGI